MIILKFAVSAILSVLSATLALRLRPGGPSIDKSSKRGFERIAL
jgi:hypothetical protein